MSVAVQAAILTVIGVIIHLVGVALYFIAKRREGLLLTLLGGLWTLAMVIFYIYSTLGFYGAVGLRAESPGPAVTTTLGFIILIIGIIVAVRLARRGGVK
jgi:uncharacterized membrane protein